MKIKILFSQFILFLTCWLFTQSAFSAKSLKVTNSTTSATIQYDCFVNQNLLQKVNTSVKTSPWYGTSTSTGGKRYFRTISSAINSSSCSKIFVYNGTYKEQLVIKRKLTITGESKDGVLLDGTNLMNPGISIDSGSTDEVRLKNFSIKNWTAYSIPNDTGAEIINGGGIAISKSNVSIKDLVIADNFGGSGGGIYIYGNDTVVTVKDTLISRNQAENSGGGIDFGVAYKGKPSTLNIDHTIINTNASARGGGIRAESDFYGGSVILNITDNSEIDHNTSYFSGGGVQVDGGAFSFSDSGLTNNSSGFNNPYEGPVGGGAYLSGSTSTISNSIVSDNFTTGSGGGIQASESTISIKNSTFSGNEALKEGGGLVLENMNASVTKSTFSGNSSQTYGGGIEIIEKSMEEAVFSKSLSNITVSNNYAQKGGDGIDLYRWENANSTDTNSLNNVTVFNNNVKLMKKTTAVSQGIRISGPTNISVSNTIIAQHSRNCVIDSSASLTSEGSNLSDDFTCQLDHSGDLVVSGGSGVLLGSLASNGGKTMTCLPLSGSPAINNGNDATCEKIDQRAQLRNDCDIGAVELVDLPIVNEFTPE